MLRPSLSGGFQYGLQALAPRPLPVAALSPVKEGAFTSQPPAGVQVHDKPESFRQLELHERPRLGQTPASDLGPLPTNGMLRVTSGLRHA